MLLCFASLPLAAPLHRDRDRTGCARSRARSIPPRKKRDDPRELSCVCPLHMTGWAAAEEEGICARDDPRLPTRGKVRRGDLQPWKSFEYLGWLSRSSRSEHYSLGCPSRPWKWPHEIWSCNLNHYVLVTFKIFMIRTLQTEDLSMFPEPYYKFIADPGGSLELYRPNSLIETS